MFYFRQWDKVAAGRVEMLRAIRIPIATGIISFDEDI
jgi:hypothetical protein